jgi:hypothetical protein
MRGEGCGGRRPAPTAAPLGPVLGHAQAQSGQVEHLAGLDPDHHRAGQVRAAPTAPVRCVPDHLIRLRDLAQVRAGGAGLLARPAASGSLGSAPLDPRGPAQPV